MKLVQFRQKYGFILLTLIPLLMLLNLVLKIGSQWELRHWAFFAFQVLLPMLYLLPFVAVFWRVCKNLNYRLFFALSLSVALLAIFNYISARIFLLNSYVQWTLWVACLVYEAINGFDFLRSSGQYLKEFLKVTGFESCLRHFLACIVVALFFCTWMLHPSLGPLYPPTTFDLSLLHLTLPQTYIFHEGIVNASWLRGVFVPQFAHILFAGGMTWASAISARIDLLPTFISSTLFFICLIGFVDFFKGNILKGLFAFALFLSFPVARWHLTTAYLEPTLMLGILATFLSACAFIETRQNRYLYLLGFFASISFSVKHFGALYAIPIILWVLIDDIKIEKRIRFKTLFKVLPFALAPVVVFYHYNYILNGSPFFPFIFNEKNQIFWDLETAKSFSSAINAFHGDRDILSWLKLPWTIGTSEKHSDTYLFPVGFLWIPMWLIANIIFLVRRFKKSSFNSIELLLFFAINFQTLIWYKSSPVFRYLTSELMLMSLFAIFMLQFAPKKAQITISIIIALFAIRNVGMLSHEAVPAPPISTPEVVAYLEERNVSYNALRQLEIKYGSNPDIVIYTAHDEGNWLYYPYPHLGDWFTVNNYSHLMPQSKDELKNFLSSRKITHVLFNGYSASLIKDFPNELGTFSQCFTRIIEGKPYPKVQIFEVNQENPICYDKNTPPHPSVVVLKTNYPRFKFLPFENDKIGPTRSGRLLTF